MHTIAIHGVQNITVEETAIRGDAAHTSIWRSIVIKTKDGATIEITLFSDTPAKLALNKESDK
jgi:hypothetical protein